MARIILWLVAAWVLLAVVGSIIKGLFWVLVVGGTLFLGIAAYGAVKTNKRPKGIKGPKP
ncbi:hypothetical protein [Saccharothrix syringae]|uniref:Uncharacterized protein n=1 Tax=Saccharothrix syringae TaxID=103733 RepID=A0A5Q0HCR5_SACSY|nr:hypothetical protein [Saccharothrix syringae]QFZ23745.1 hypothetical protein EKG83_45530 [Saccharothrix syringae]